MTQGRYDYPYGVNRIELDEEEAEYVRCTCLDRARIALEQTGQHHCAMQMGELQKKFDVIAEEWQLDPNMPNKILCWLYAAYGDYWDIIDFVRGHEEPSARDAETFFQECSR